MSYSMQTITSLSPKANTSQYRQRECLWIPVLGASAAMKRVLPLPRNSIAACTYRKGDAPPILLNIKCLDLPFGWFPK